MSWLHHDSIGQLLDDPFHARNGAHDQIEHHGCTCCIVLFQQALQNPRCGLGHLLCTHSILLVLLSTTVQKLAPHLALDIFRELVLANDAYESYIQIQVTYLQMPSQARGSVSIVIYSEYYHSRSWQGKLKPTHTLSVVRIQGSADPMLLAGENKWEDAVENSRRQINPRLWK